MRFRSIITDPVIMLHSGRTFDFTNPDANEITVEDIAHGLAHTCRFAGQCNEFFSVAEHSVLVSQVVTGPKLAALFHDAAEAFIGDMSAPLKRLLTEYQAIERAIQRAIFTRFDIEWPVPPDVKEAEYRVLAAEQKILMPARTNEWLQESNITPANVTIQRLAPPRAKKLFLDRYAQLATTM